MENNIQIKKSYNPFKMWGSWVGILIVVIWMFFFSGTAYIFKEAPPHLGGSFNCPTFGVGGSTDNGCGFFSWLFGITPIIFYVIFFLLGWGIHSLVRRFKK
ncbi:MAG: hypothetical protein V1788_00340 [Nanoarchaeota archaeon]